MPSKTADPARTTGTKLPKARVAVDGARDGESDGKPTTSMRKTIDLGKIDDLQILSENGDVDASLDPNLPPDELKKIHRAMVLTRKLDQRMLAMQRQGEMGTFAPGIGQEATQIGQVYPLLTKDWYSPSYRSFGAQLWRGWQLDQLMLLWAGYFEGFEIPTGVNDLPFSIVIGSHVLPATGVAMAIRARGEDAVVLTNFGDGASSQGAVNEAFNFAAVFCAPVVFVLENNGWAISVPVEKQCGVNELARRGPAFGIPSIRVDGNDILAMIVAAQEAVAHARAGNGAYLIEAVTYRMSLHTTADDPKVYRKEEQVKQWEAKCPIARFEKYLKQKNVLNDADLKRISEECEKEVLDARESFRARAKVKPREVFDFIFASLPPELEEQQREYFARLDRKGIE